MVQCQYCNKFFSIRGIATHKSFCVSNPDKKERTSNHGGYRNGSGRGKSGWYKGIHCDSSWELAYILYCELHNIEIKRYDGDKLEYVSVDGVIHNYIPDFIINNETIVEIKGFSTEVSELKRAQHPEILYLDKSYMDEILKQVESKYGTDFITNYDGSVPVKKTKILRLKKVKVQKEKKVRKIHTCEKCGVEYHDSKYKKSRKYCSPECYQASNQRFEITSDELKELVWKYPTSTVGKMYGVSGKAIEKRCIKFGIDKPPRGYWSKR